jgi:hypothetical protein
MIFSPSEIPGPVTGRPRTPPIAVIRETTAARSSIRSPVIAPLPDRFAEITRWPQ